MSVQHKDFNVYKVWARFKDSVTDGCEEMEIDPTFYYRHGNA